jgi:hypothetical protein
MELDRGRSARRQFDNAIVRTPCVSPKGAMLGSMPQRKGRPKAALQRLYRWL